MKNNSLFVMKEIKRDKEREIFFFKQPSHFPRSPDAAQPLGSIAIAVYGGSEKHHGICEKFKGSLQLPPSAHQHPELWPEVGIKNGVKKEEKAQEGTPTGQSVVR